MAFTYETFATLVTLGAAMTDADLIIVGGGPAGVMAGLLFARAGCSVRILEKHADFFRDFRGDTVHPSTMEILDQLGMLERFLARPHNRLDKASSGSPGANWTIGDLSHLHTAGAVHRHDAAVGLPRFPARRGQGLPGLPARDGSAGRRLHRGEGQRSPASELAGGRELTAPLVIAADGRAFDRPRDAARSRTWARRWTSSGSASASSDAETGGLRGNVERGRLLVMIDRGDYWQCAFLIPKGAAEQYQRAGHRRDPRRGCRAPRRSSTSPSSTRSAICIC